MFGNESVEHQFGAKFHKARTVFHSFSNLAALEPVADINMTT